MNVLKYFLALLLLGSLFACGEKIYTQRVFNESGREVHNVIVHYGELQSSFGVIIADSQKTKMSMKTPPPDVAKVTWIDSNQKPYSANVDLSIVPEDYNDGVITFVIEKDFTVSVGFYIREPMNF